MFEVGQIIIDDENYQKCAEWCNSNGCYIEEIEPKEDGTRQFQICEVPAPTEEELIERELNNELRDYESKLSDIKDRLSFAILMNDEDLISELRKEYMELL